MTGDQGVSVLARSSSLRDGNGVVETIAMQDRVSVDEAEFKIAMRQVTSCVCVVTARAGKFRNGLTATSVCSVTMEPPTMLVCVNRKSRADAMIAESGAFAINVLADQQHKIARLFSTSQAEPEDRFAEGRWIAMATGAPVLADAVASFDCKLESRVWSGSHHVYFGRVVAVASFDQQALLYRDGVFRRLAAIV
jgi:flavin reductase